MLFQWSQGCTYFCKILDPYLVPNPVVEISMAMLEYLVENLNFMTQALNQRSMQYYCCYSQYRESHLTWTPIAHHEGVYLLSRATVTWKTKTFVIILSLCECHHSYSVWWTINLRHSCLFLAESQRCLVVRSKLPLNVSFDLLLLACLGFFRWGWDLPLPTYCHSNPL